VLPVADIFPADWVIFAAASSSSVRIALAGEPTIRELSEFLAFDDQRIGADDAVIADRTVVFMPMSVRAAPGPPASV